MGYSLNDIIKVISKASPISIGEEHSSLVKLNFPKGESLYVFVENKPKYDVLEIFDSEGLELQEKDKWPLYIPALINDKDGFVNVRSGKSAKSSVVGKIEKDKVFFFIPSKGNWYKISYHNQGKCVGFVHKSKVLMYEQCTKNQKKLIREALTYCSYE